MAMTFRGHMCKIVAIGDGAVGKTCFLMVYVQNSFPKEYVPTVFENHETYVRSNSGEQVRLSLWDTAGQEEYDNLRHLSYPNTNVFIIMFSAVNKSSLANVETKWIGEIREKCPGNKPIILVATKTDLRDNRDEWVRNNIQEKDVVTTDEGEKMARSIRAYDYIETSSYLQTNISKVVEKALEAHFKGLLPPEKQEGCCNII
ncbi:Ras-related protein Rac [Acrasis kona]|uniref:Ras-related protein Rac n=1 Tax=Acrasis kona TaxID=1008807 RepID=A0AAW2ZJP3_9EUKA